MNPVNWVLSYAASRYLRSYISEIENEQVQVGIWSGDVTLNDVQLNPIQLPSQLVANGTIGELTLRIPWKKITTSSCSLSLKNISIVITQEEEEANTKTREQLLEEFESSVASRRKTFE